MQAYNDFLSTRLASAPNVGFAIKEQDLHASLFPFQRPEKTTVYRIGMPKMIDEYGIIISAKTHHERVNLTTLMPCYTIHTPALLARDESLQPSRRNGAGFVLLSERQMTTYIYGLIDPFTDEMRYIGKSIRPEGRLRDHCNDHSDCHRTHWIQSVLARGERPKLVILQELDDSADWQQAERDWIAKVRSEGARLTNSTDGGDGVLNLCAESKAKMLKTWTGRKHRPESLQKMADASRGRVKSEASKQIMREKMRGRVITWADKVSKGVRKLTDNQVREIRIALAAHENQDVLAARYKVNQGTISNIKRKLCYTDVLDELAA